MPCRGALKESVANEPSRNKASLGATGFARNLRFFAEPFEIRIGLSLGLIGVFALAAWSPQVRSSHPIRKTMVISKITISIIQPQACGRFVIPVSPPRLADMKGAEPGAMPRQSRLLKIQYAAITAMKNDMRSVMPAMAAIMVA